MTFSKTTAITFFFFIAFLASAFAQTAWREFTSDTNLFTAKLPNTPKENAHPFRIGFDQLLYATDVTSVIEGKDPKSFSVIAEQTFAPGITNANKNLIIKQELDRYARHYKPQQGVVRMRDDTASKDTYAGEIMISYIDPKTQAKQDMRARITVNDDTKFQQVAIGPEGFVYGLQAKDFFDSLKTRSKTKDESRDEQEWQEMRSPFDLFTLEIPPVIPPFVAHAPEVQSSDKIEMISQIFTDPVWNYNVYYKVYGYRFDTNLTTANVQDVMAKNHIQKHGRNPYDLEFGQTFPNGIPTLEVTYQIAPPDGYPYLNTVRLRAMYLDNTMVVQEMIGKHFLVQSDFMRNTFDLIDFSPKAAFKKQVVDKLEDIIQKQN